MLRRSVGIKDDGSRETGPDLAARLGWKESKGNRRRPRSMIELNPDPAQNFLGRSNPAQQEMAILVGIPETYFSQLMNWDRSPSARLHGRIQEIVGAKDFHPVLHHAGLIRMAAQLCPLKAQEAFVWPT